MVTSNNHYVVNEDLMEPLRQYRKEFYEARENVAERPKLPDSVGIAICMIADGLTKRWNWTNYTYKDEMRQDAIENCVKYIHNFDPDKYSKPFSYINMICHNAFVRRMQHEKKHQYIKTSLIKKSMDATVATQDHDDRVYSNTFIDFMKDVLDDEDVAMLEMQSKQEEHKRNNESSYNSILDDEENLIEPDDYEVIQTDSKEEVINDDEE